MRVLPREAYDALPRAARTTARTAVLPQGTSTSEVVALLATHSDAPLVRLPTARAQANPPSSPPPTGHS